MNILVLAGLCIAALIFASALFLAACALLSVRRERKRAGIAPLRRRLAARVQMRLQRPVPRDGGPLAGDALAAFTDVMRAYRHCHAGPEALAAEHRAVQAARERQERR